MGKGTGHCFQNFTLLIIAVIMVNNIDSVTGECAFSNSSDEYTNNANGCYTIIECIDHAFNDLYPSDFSKWLETIEYEQNCPTIDKIHFHLYMSDIAILGNIFLSRMKLESCIDRLTIINSKYMPTNITKLHLTDIKINYNTIRNINLNDLLPIKELKTINASHNHIMILETELNGDAGTESSNVISIDLSYNSIEFMPSKCFLYFSQLQYLDLSHNAIIGIDIVIFDGISRLQTLELSFNKLNQIGQILSKFVTLRELMLNNNNITSLSQPNFSAMQQLEKMNLSSNKIENIEDNSFRDLVQLKELDLSNNKISIISNTLHRNNNALHLLCLSNNQIKTVESGAFEGKNISTFSIRGNNLTGLLKERAFEGLHLKKLDLSGGLITELESEVFKASHISSLNLSSNVITSMPKTSFHEITSLVELDLSNNELTSIDFDTSDIKELSILLARNNLIKLISENTFQNLSKLHKLDLSYNAITEVESQSFKDLETLEMLDLSYNNFVNSIDAHAFAGLTALIRIELHHTTTQSMRDKAFSGLKSLKYLNCSRGELWNISFDAFKSTGSLEIIDLSSNLLEHFLVNTSSISLVQELYLNINKLTHISNEMLSGLAQLQKLDLANNNILKVESKAFTSLMHLSYLYVSSNNISEMSGNIFENLVSLLIVSLDHNNIHLNFEHTNNTSIQELNMVSCNIQNTNSLFIFKVNNLVNLNMSKNKISFIDKFTFQNMPSLRFLDLRFNSISSIQPGSFRNLNSMRVLLLYGNDISSLQFGVFDGPREFDFLLLSNNSLHSFDVNLLHNIQQISMLSLDNNLIEDFRFEDFVNKKLDSITIGGNLISCHVFTELKSKQSINFNVTAVTLDYHSENVDGITCRSDAEKYKHMPLLNNTNANTTYTLSKLGNAIDNLRESIDKISSETEYNETNSLKKDITDILVTIDEHIINNTNALTSQIDNNINLKELTDVMKQLANVSKETQSHVVHIDEYIINKNRKMGSEGDINARNKLEAEKLLNMENEIRKYLESDTKFNGNTLMYINVLCLLIITVILFLSLIHSFYKSRNMLGRNPEFHNSVQPITNGMEMQ